MSKKDNNIFLGPNKGLNVIGEHAYAMSGVVSVDNNITSLLDFTTGGPEYIEGWIQVYASTTQANDFEINVKYNGQTIISSEYEKTYSGQFVNGIPRRVIIPALTHVEITAQNTQGTATADWTVVITGRVYG
jgi:hypothetical protein